MPNPNFLERLHVIDDAKTGLKGVIAIHSTALGPAAGGCRFWHYPSQDVLITDAIRLARGMSYKNALAGLPFGGGKAVLQRPEGDFDREAVFHAFAEAVAELGGAYITAEDVGTMVGDMRAVRERTPYVAGLDHGNGTAGGDPSPWTALGVFESMRAAVTGILGVNLSDVSVAVQGAGNVGSGLCRLLAQAGAKLIVADVDCQRAVTLAQEVGAAVVNPDEICEVAADVYAPCALGAVFNDNSIPKLKARLICGGANNQLEHERHGAALHERGIIYAPDYVVNAGGIINVSAEYLGETTAQVEDRIRQIAPRLLSILQEAKLRGQPANVIADDLAKQTIALAKREAA